MVIKLYIRQDNNRWVNDTHVTTRVPLIEPHAVEFSAGGNDDESLG